MTTMHPGRHRTGLRTVLLASVSGLTLLTLASGQVAAQSSVFVRRGADSGAAASAARASGIDTSRMTAQVQGTVNTFARAAAATNAAAALQSAARQAAAATLNTSVPNGLSPGGLVPSTGASLWVGADRPVQENSATEAARVMVTVRQTQQRAILTWDSFNVGQKTTLTFDQSAGGTESRRWSVLNRVEDPSLAPSRILGSIKADGAVYVINRNGIVFEGGSQVNAATLVASALDVGTWGDNVGTRNARFLKGILNVDPGGPNMLPTLSLDQFAVLDSAARPRRVTVEVMPGAQLIAGESGQIVLAGPQVVNRGTLSAPAGQVILAAGLGVRLDTAQVGAATSPNIGLMVESLRRGPDNSPQWDNFRGVAHNEGIVSAPRGNVTMVGADVSSSGVLSATTGNDRNGSIILTARDVGGTLSVGGGDAHLYRFGTITLLPGSLTTVTGDTGADQPVFDTSATFQQSQISFTASAVLMGADALIHAPAGTLRMAGDLTDRGLFPDGTLRAGRLRLVSLDQGAVIDLAGLKDVKVPIARNFIDVEARGIELRDSPLQRNGLLYQMAQRNEKLTIDIRVGTALLDWQPAAALVPRGIAERQTAGGSLDIAAQRIFTASGSLIDVSGGYITYVGGSRPQTTRLLGADGRIYDIGSAPVDLAYTALAGQFTTKQPRWGISRVYVSGLRGPTEVHEPGYVSGFDAGSVTLAGRPYLDGGIQGGALTGTRQALAGKANDGDRLTATDLPSGGSLSFLGNQLDRFGALVVRTETTGVGALVNPTFVDTVTTRLPADFAAQLTPAPDVLASSDARYTLGGGMLPAERFDSQISTRAITNRGFSNISLAADGQLTIPAGVTVQLSPGGSFTANVSSAAIGGTVSVPGGRITIATNAGERITAIEEDIVAAPTAWAVRDTVPLSPADGRLTIAPTAMLSVRGRWSNDLLASQTGDPVTGTGYINGGDISLQTRWTPVASKQPVPEGAPEGAPGGATVDTAATPIMGRDIVLGAGAVLDVAGGAALAEISGNPSLGRGGSLSLATYTARATSPTGGLADPTKLGLPVVGIGQAGVRIAAGPGGILDEGAVLSGHGAAVVGRAAANGRGGVISLTVPNIMIGRDPTEVEATYGGRRMDPVRLATLGFADIQLTATTAGGLPFLGLPAGTLNIAPDTVVAPVATQFVLSVAARQVPTGAAGSMLGAPEVLTVTDRAPTRLTLTAQNAMNLGGAGTVLQVDPGAARTDTAPLISLTSVRGMLVEGSLIAPAGQIRVTGSGSPAAYTTPIDLVPVREFNGLAYLPGESTWVAATARLLARGIAQEVVTATGQMAGVPRPGGTVTLAEGRGALVVEAGAILDVSGVSGRTDTLLSGGGINTARRGSIDLASNAGGINLTGARGLFLDGTLLARPGGTGAMGGTLTINAPSPQAFLDGVSQIGSVPNGISGRLGIVVTADPVTLPTGASRTDGVDPSLTRLANGSWSGDHLDRVRLSVSRLEGSGIDRLTLFGGGLGVTFLGDVALDVPRMIQIEGSRVTAAPGTVAPGALGAPTTAGAVANARLSSAYVVLNGQIGGNAAALAGGKLAGALSISANALDLIGGVTLDGADKVTLASSGDLRLIGSQYLTTEYGQVQGGLRSGGDLTLRAAQVYPTAGTAFTITATGRDITLARLEGDIPRAPLSAAGSVSLEAATIAQGGVLRAPQGEIRLRPTAELVFLPGSLTSVSADDRIVPLGQIDGFTYQASLLATNPQQPNGVTSAPQKLLDIAGPRIRVEPGAVLDASGGGDLLAYTFISGPGGSRDVLARADYTITNGTVGATNHRFADQRDVFAILPDLGSAIAPYSPYILDSGTSLGRGEVTAPAAATGVNRYGQQVSGSLPWVGDRITITQNSPVLPAGSYTLLPGRYAMLPGALRVTFGPAATVPTVVPLTASPVLNRDGSWQVQGVRGIAGTNVQDTVPRSIRLETTPVWSQYSSLTFDTANSFFPARAARLDQQVGRLPIDAGRLSLSASETLTLGGTIRFNHADAGRGGQVDIASSMIAITPNGVASTVPGALVLSDVALSAIGAETLTIGGTRQYLDGKDIILPSARSVTVATGARLTGPDVVLVARAPTATRPGDGLLLESGADVTASGSLRVSPLGLQLGRLEVIDLSGTVITPGESGDGALLRVSAGPLVPVTRATLDAGAATSLSVLDGARLGGRAVTLDATGAMQIGERVGLTASALDLGARAIVLGNPPTGAGDGALVLRSGLLGNLAGVTDLSLRSRGGIDVHGRVDLVAAGALTLDAAAVRGFGAAILNASAGGLAILRNSGAVAPTGSANGTGTLSLIAAAVRIGGGNVALQGFPSVRLATHGELTTVGAGELSTAGGVTIVAGRVSSGAGADYALTTTGALRIEAPVSPTTLGPVGLGGRLSMTAAELTLATSIVNPSGDLNLTATGGPLTLAAGASIDLSGRGQAFFDRVDYTPGGRATLVAGTGSIVVAPGVSPGVIIDVSAPIAGVDSGSVTLTAQRGQVDVGNLSLRGGPAGRFSLDTLAAVDLGRLNTQLDAGGFRGGRSIRTRTGDLVLASDQTVSAQQVNLTADGGQVSIAGAIDASGAKGGTIGLFGMTGVTLAGGALLNAKATEAGQPGGLVEIGTGTGPLRLAGSVIDVTGGDPLRGSLVRMRVPVGAVAASTFTTQVQGARRVEVEPYSVTQTATIEATAITAAFNAIRTLNLQTTVFAGFPANWRVTPGVELRNFAGDLTLPVNRAITLLTSRTATGDPGVLTLRAGGNLVLLSSVSDGFASAAANALPSDTISWSYRLVGGADFSSASPLATMDASQLVGQSGNIQIGRPWLYDPANPATTPTTLPVFVRTGTGSIDVAAALDVQLRDPDAAIYTAGRPIANPTTVSGLTADGEVATGRFILPLPPTYSGYLSQYPSPSEFEPGPTPPNAAYAAAYTEGGGSLRLAAGRDITQVLTDPAGNNAGQTPNEWLWRRGAVNDEGAFMYRPALPLRGVFDGFGLRLRAIGESSTQTSWWVNFSLFRQGFGVLGGGDASVVAGRDFRGSVSIPTNARVGGGLPTSYVTQFAQTNGRIATLSGTVPNGGTPAVLAVNGGGDLMLSVGRDLVSGSQFLVGRGEAVVRAGGTLASSRVGGISPTDLLPIQASVGTMIALGDASVRVSALGSISASIYDPLQVMPGRDLQLADAWGYGGSTAPGTWRTNTVSSTVTLNSLGGNVTLLGTLGSAEPHGALQVLQTAPRAIVDGATIYRNIVSANAGTLFNNATDLVDRTVEYLPASLAVTVFSGDIGFQSVSGGDGALRLGVQLAPFATGQLTLLAAGSIVNPNLSLPDVNPAGVATAFRPIYDSPAFAPPGRLSPDGGAYISNETPALAATSPLRAADPDRALVYAVGGSIPFATISSGKRIGVHAHLDITDATISVQHAADGDVSFVWAGRDIRSASSADLGLEQQGVTMEVRGPGRLQILAGRDIDQIRPPAQPADPRTAGLANNGLHSVGNQYSSLYPPGSATIDVLYGLGVDNVVSGGLDSSGFLRQVLAPDFSPGRYQVDLTRTANGGATWAIRPKSPEATGSATLAAVLALPEPERLGLAIDLMVRELAASGQEAARGGSNQGNYTRGFAAINSLFPDGNYSGRLSLQNTYVRTDQGGDVNVLGPGGDFILGGISTTVDRYPDRIGALTLGYGSLNFFAHGDIQLGQSRAFTVDGGDILMWSSTRDINAGLGAKTARYIPPYQVSYTFDGTWLANRSALVTGSGIGTFPPVTPLNEVASLLRVPTSSAMAAAQQEEIQRRTAPNITLIAPVGIVDFGDAGVRSAGNLSVAAQTVLNAANAQVTGSSTGVPLVSSPNVAAAVAASATAGQTSGAGQDAARQAARGAGALPEDAPATISVDVVGVGGNERDAGQ